MIFEGEIELGDWKRHVIYKGKEYESISWLASELGVSRQAVHAALRKGKKVKGEYVKDATQRN